MKDWKIGLLVVMCVVFIVCLIILLFLLWKYGKWSVKSNALRTLESDAEESSNNWHYGNYQLEIPMEQQEPHVKSFEQNQENTKMPAYAASRNCALAKDGDASERSNCTLWFMDFTNHVHSIDLQANGQIERGWQVQNVIAQMCNMDTPETLSLVYRDEKQTMNWLDLDLLVNRDDQFCNRMRQTAERPLLLARLTEVQVHNMSTHNNRIKADESNVCTVSNFKRNDLSRANGNIDNKSMFVEVDVNEKKHRLASASNKDNFRSIHSPQINHSPQPTKSSCISQTAPVDTSSTSNHNHHHHNNNNYSNNKDNRYSETTVVTSVSPPLLAPTPIIFPEEEYITTRTAINIIATDYYLVSNISDFEWESLRGNDTSSHASDKKAWPSQLINVIDENKRLQLDMETFLEFERAMCSRAKHRSIQLRQGPFANTLLKVHSHTNVISWHFPGKVCYELVRHSANILRFSVDGANPDQWSLYTQPFYLPLGR